MEQREVWSIPEIEVLIQLSITGFGIDPGEDNEEYFGTS